MVTAVHPIYPHGQLQRPFWVGTHPIKAHFLPCSSLQNKTSAMAGLDDAGLARQLHDIPLKGKSAIEIWKRPVFHRRKGRGGRKIEPFSDPCIRDAAMNFVWHYVFSNNTVGPDDGPSPN